MSARMKLDRSAACSSGLSPLIAPYVPRRAVFALPSLIPYSIDQCRSAVHDRDATHKGMGLLIRGSVGRSELFDRQCRSRVGQGRG